jgi:hypothetical protein
VLVYLRKWAQDPVLLAKNIVVVLVTESLAELDPKLVRASATREVEISRPDLAERREYLEAVRPGRTGTNRLSEIPPPRLAELTAGMTRAQLAQLLDGAEAADAKLTLDGVRAAKKEVIETEGHGPPRVRRAQVRPRHGGRDAGHQGAPAARRPRHRARQPLRRPHGLPDLRPRRQRQDLPRRVLSRARSASRA